MNRQSLNTLANVFGVCFLLCAGIQLFALGINFALHDWIVGPSSPLMQIFGQMSESQYDFSFYCFLTLMKTLGLTFFLVPWASLKIASRWFAE